MTNLAMQEMTNLIEKYRATIRQIDMECTVMERNRSTLFSIVSDLERLRDKMEKDNAP